MVIDGWDAAAPISHRGVSHWRLALQETGGGTLDDTARLSHITDWDTDGPGAMAYGLPDALGALENRDIPSGRTVDRMSYEFVDPEDPQWEDVQAREIFELDERLQIQEAPIASDGGALTRRLLNHGGQLSTAFRLDERNALDEFSFYEGTVPRFVKRAHPPHLARDTKTTTTKNRPSSVVRYTVS